MLSALALGATACTPEERNFGNSGGAGGTGGSAGAGGSGLLCVPNTQQEACYTGPPDTLEVGPCKAGIHVCLPSGMAFGECGGEVLPTLEDCLTPADEACNGNEPAECLPLADGWLQAFGSAPNFPQTVQDIAIMNNGEIVVVGGFAGTIDFGVGPMASTGLFDIFVAKFDPLGKAIWSKRFGDASSQVAMAVAIDKMGAIYVGGSMAGSVDFGGTLLTSAGGDDAFLARFETDGTFAWGKKFGDVAKQSIRHLEVTKTNTIIVAGEFAGTLQLDAGGQNTHMSMGSTDVFVARFDTSGFIGGSRAFGGTQVETVRGMALDSTDQVYLTGGFEGTMEFYGLDRTSTGVRDAYVAVFTPNLSANTALAFGNPNGPMTYQEGYDIAVNGNDEVYVSGGFVQAIDVDGKFLTNLDPLDRSMFLAHFGPQLGGPTTAQQFGGLGGNVNEARLAFDPLGKHVVIAGSFAGDIDFGGGLLHADEGPDPFFAKLALDGTFIAARTLLNDTAVFDNGNNINALALLPSGDLIIGGVERAPIVFGKGFVGELDEKDGNALLGRFLH